MSAEEKLIDIIAEQLSVDKAKVVSGASFVDDDQQKPATRRTDPCCGRCLSSHANEGCLSETLPNAHCLRRRSLATRRWRRLLDGASSWSLLCRLLLALDGTALCRRGNEPVVDRSLRSLCPA